MMIDVHLHGAETMRFATRGDFVEVVRRDPSKLDEDRAQRCWLDRGQGEGFAPARIQFVGKGSIAWVEQISGVTRDAFLAIHDAELLDRIRAKERHREAREQQVAEAPAA